MLLWPPGTGKAHLATGFAILARQARHHVQFVAAPQWVDRLAEAHHAGRLQDELRRLVRGHQRREPVTERSTFSCCEGVSFRPLLIIVIHLCLPIAIVILLPTDISDGPTPAACRHQPAKDLCPWPPEAAPVA